LTGVLFLLVSVAFVRLAGSQTEQVRLAREQMEIFKQVRDQPGIAGNRVKRLEEVFDSLPKRIGLSPGLDPVMGKVSSLASSYRIDLLEVNPGETVPRTDGTAGTPLRLVMSGSYASILSCWRRICLDQTGIFPSGFALTSDGNLSRPPRIRAELDFIVYSLPSGTGGQE
jgi:hypothetical protein